MAATKSTGDLFGSFGLWFSHPTLIANLHQLFTAQDGIYLRWAFNSVLYAGVGAIAATLLSGLAGYGLSKFGFAAIVWSST